MRDTRKDMEFCRHTSFEQVLGIRDVFIPEPVHGSHTDVGRRETLQVLG